MLAPGTGLPFPSFTFPEIFICEKAPFPIIANATTQGNIFFIMDLYDLDIPYNLLYSYTEYKYKLVYYINQMNLKKARLRQARPLLIVPFKTKTSNNMYCISIFNCSVHTPILPYFSLVFCCREYRKPVI